MDQIISLDLLTLNEQICQILRLKLPNINFLLEHFPTETPESSQNMQVSKEHIKNPLRLTFEDFESLFKDTKYELTTQMSSHYESFLKYCFQIWLEDETEKAISGLFFWSTIISLNPDLTIEKKIKYHQSLFSLVNLNGDLTMFQFQHILSSILSYASCDEEFEELIKAKLENFTFEKQSSISSLEFEKFFLEKNLFLTGQNQLDRIKQFKSSNNFLKVQSGLTELFSSNDSVGLNIDGLDKSNSIFAISLLQPEISTEEIEKFYQAYQKFNPVKGLVTKWMFRKIFQLSGIKNSDFIESLFDCFDFDKNGMLDYKDFMLNMCFLRHRDCSPDKQKVIWKILDIHNTEYIDLSELREVYKQINQPQDEQKILEIFTSMDLKKHKKISWEEFKEASEKNPNLLGELPQLNLFLDRVLKI